MQIVKDKNGEPRWFAHRYDLASLAGLHYVGAYPRDENRAWPLQLVYDGRQTSITLFFKEEEDQERAYFMILEALGARPDLEQGGYTSEPYRSVLAS